MVHRPKDVESRIESASRRGGVYLEKRVFGLRMCWHMRLDLFCTLGLTLQEDVSRHLGDPKGSQTMTKYFAFGSQCHRYRSPMSRHMPDTTDKKVVGVWVGGMGEARSPRE